MIFTFFPLIIILLAAHGQAVEVQVISKLIQDLIENERIPTILSMVSCWTQMDNIYFLKSSNVRIQFINQMKIPPHRFDENTNKMCYFIDMRCNGSHELLNRIEATYFGHPYRWILFEPIENRLLNATFLTDSNIVLINSNETLSRYHLKQVYKIDKQQPNFISETFGHWNSSDGLVDLRETRILSRRRRNLNGKVLKSMAVVTNNNSINHLDDIKNPTDYPAKLSYCITNLMAESMNASVTYEYVNTWGYGDMNHPEKLKGIMGPLVRNEIDVGGTVLFITPERLPYIEYLSDTFPLYMAFVFRAPPLSHVANIFSLPFDTKLWICVLFILILCTTINGIIYFFTMDKNKKVDKSDFLLFAIGTACQMGVHIFPKCASGKIATFVFCLCAIFVYTSYTANIVVLLQSTSKSIHTLSDLLNFNMKLGVEDNPYARHYFLIETEPIRKKIYETKIAPPNEQPHFVNASYGISMVRKGFYAFHMSLSTGYKEIERTFYEHEKCGLLQIKYFESISAMHAAPKNSPIKEIFKVNLFKLREHGLQSVERSRRSTKKPICNTRVSRFESVRIIDCVSVIIMGCYGIVAALIVLCIELILNKLYSLNANSYSVPSKM